MWGNPALRHIDLIVILPGLKHAGKGLVYKEPNGPEELALIASLLSQPNSPSLPISSRDGAIASAWFPLGIFTGWRSLQNKTTFVLLP